MKKYIIMTLVGILISSCATTTEKEIRNLERFDKVNLTGRVELKLEKNANNSVEILTKKDADMAGITTEVRNGELFIYHEDDCDSCKTPKYIVKLNHSGISDLTLTGVIRISLDEVISQTNLAIRGDGVLNGNIEVAVDNLHVDLNGISNMYISGSADTSDLKISGIGFFNVRNLETKSGKNVSEGLAIINKL